jgi:hypothetical protein
MKIVKPEKLKFSFSGFTYVITFNFLPKTLPDLLRSE